MSDRALAHSLMDSIDYLDPCSRQRQKTAIGCLAERFQGRKFTRITGLTMFAVVAVTMLVAFL